MMLEYQKKSEAVNLSDAAIKFISYAESVGAIREDSSFLKESLVQLFTPTGSTELEQFNRTVADSLGEDSTQKESANG